MDSFNGLFVVLALLIAINRFLSFHSTQLDAAKFYQAARSPYLMIHHFRGSVCYKTFLTVCADQLL